MKESNKRRLSPEEIEKIREMRANDPEKRANKEAYSLLPHIVSLGAENNNPNNIMQIVLADHIKQSSPIPLVGFWGVGEKASADLFDKSYINSLAEMEQKAQGHYSAGAKITIILADLHGRFNGYPEEDMNGYLFEVSENLRDAEINSVYLSNLYDQAGLVLPDSTKPIEWNNVSRGTQNWTDWVYLKHKDQIVNSAKAHHKGELDPNSAAYYYISMRLNEREMLSDSFPNSILLVNGTKHTSQPLLPYDMPILYLREGPPWFRKEGK